MISIIATQHYRHGVTDFGGALSVAWDSVSRGVAKRSLLIGEGHFYAASSECTDVVSPHEVEDALL